MMEPLFNFYEPQLGVVPVLVNTGVAVLPAILAGLASVAALLFKPKQLIRACRQNPGKALATFLSLGLVAGGIYWFATKPPADHGTATRSRNSTPGTGSGPTSDWASVAREIIRQNERNPVPVAVATAVPVETIESGPILFRANNQRTGVLGETSPVALQAAWEFEAEAFSHVLSSPVRHGDKVFAASAMVDVGVTYGIVFAVDAVTGQKIWQTQSAPGGDFRGFFSSPSITADGKYLLIGEGLHEDANCRLICLDTETGEVVWTVPTPIHVESSPAISGDIAVVGAGAIEKGDDHKPQGDPEGIGNPGYVFAVQISTGEELWRYPVIDPESTPAIRDGIVYIGSGVNGDAVVALRLEAEDEDRLLWKTDVPYPALGPITLTGDLLLIGCGTSNYVFSDPNPKGVIIALDPETGEEKWQVETADSVLGPISVRGTTAVVAVRSVTMDGRAKGLVKAIDLTQQGKTIWEYPFSRPAFALAGPAYSEDVVYAVSNDGYLILIDANSGEQIEEHYINAPGKPGDSGLSFSSPFVAGGFVYVGSETGGLRALQGTQDKGAK